MIEFKDYIQCGRPRIEEGIHNTKVIMQINNTKFLTIGNHDLEFIHTF